MAYNPEDFTEGRTLHNFVDKDDEPLLGCRGGQPLSDGAAGHVLAAAAVDRPATHVFAAADVDAAATCAGRAAGRAFRRAAGRAA